MLELLTDRVEPLGADQLVHADLTGNVLLTRDAPPGIIDISPYWRPPAYAEGIVVADAMCWHDATAITPRGCVRQRWSGRAWPTLQSSDHE